MTWIDTTSRKQSILLLRPLTFILVLSLAWTGKHAHCEPSEKLEALQYLAKVKEPGKEFRDGIQGMVDYIEYASQARPDSVDNLVKLVEARTMVWCFGFVPRDEVLPKMKADAERAVKLDGQNAGAHTALGIVKLSQWDWQEADSELAMAVKLDPQRAESRHWYALYLASRGRHKEALAQSKIAVDLDKSSGMKTGMGAVLYFGRDWQGMVDLLVPVTEKDKKFAPALDWLGMAYVQEQRFEESISAYERATVLSGGLAEITAGLGHAYGLASEKSKARDVLQELQRWSTETYVPPVQIAYVHLSLGENDEAFKRLEQAYQQHSWELVFMQVEPWFDKIRSDPRFQELEEKMGFPEHRE